MSTDRQYKKIFYFNQSQAEAFQVEYIPAQPHVLVSENTASE